ncbi:MAG: hypothetical protein LIP01_12910 [Tannerellaceae bacterium]|nr:hypothetical protein [Tannerellaceae bacterium]
MSWERPVRFTVVNQADDVYRQLWGTIYVTFSSPENKFADVRVGIYFPRRKITILGLASALDVRAYNIAFPSPYHQQGINRMVTSPKNFGSLPESTVKVGELEIIGYNCEGIPRNVTNPTNPDANWKQGDLAKWLNVHNPDVIVLAYPARVTDEVAGVLKQYVDNGGALLAYTAEATFQPLSSVQILLNELLEINLSGTTSFLTYNDGIIFSMKAGPEYDDEPVLNGPFGNIQGLNFGMYLYYAGVSTSLIEDKVHTLVSTDDKLTSTYSPRSNNTLAFRHKTLNFIWVGNGKGTGSYYPLIPEPYHDVIANDEVNFEPERKPGFGYGSVKGADNAFFFMNAMAWLIEVTNHVPPAGGY